MMSREQVALSIVRMRKAYLQLMYWQELSPDTYPSVLDSQLALFGAYIRGVDSYLESYPDDKVYQMLLMIGNTNELLSFIERFEDIMPNKVKESLLFFIPVYSRLVSDGETIHTLLKLDRKYLADGLDNPEAEALLKRAQDINILDDKFQPTPGVSRKQLKIIAFAVAQLTGLEGHFRWHSFNSQWPHEGGRLATVSLPSRDRKDMKLITDLYPEVDFTSLFEFHGNVFFKSKMTREQIDSLFCRLRDNGYIDNGSKLKDFRGVFTKDGNSEEHPINWIKSRRQLCILIYHLLRPYNKIDAWSKAEVCFRVQGQRVNRKNISDYLTKIKKSGQLCTYDTKLMEIVRPFM